MGKIFDDKVYMFEQLVLFTLHCEKNEWGTKILMDCFTPGFKVFSEAYFNITKEHLYQLLDRSGKNGKQLQGFIERKLENKRTKKFKILVYKQFGPVLIDKFTVFGELEEHDPEFDWVEFAVLDVLKDPDIPYNGSRKLKDIAADIYILALKEGYDHGAMWEYLDAMLDLDSIHEDYGADRGTYITKAFLGNIRYWKGEKIGKLRNEIKELITEAETYC
ncbi:hypothetical protein JYT51_01565 [Candidatus Amoebophilus asiaticus]|nr:hypothetical protein [Candidatus Amoebophilus asiaticus]